MSQTKIMLRCFAFFYFFSFLFNTSFAQHFQFKTYQLEGGHSRGLIKGVIADEIGFIWSATDEGLIRYDGSHSIFFKDELPGGFAKALCSRTNGQLLVLHDFGLTEIISKADTTYFKKILSAGKTDTDEELFYPKTIFEDIHENIWIGENQTIVRFASEKIKKYRLNCNPLLGLRFKSFSFAEDDFGKLWVISNSGNFYSFKPQEDVFVEIPLGIHLENVNSLTKIGTDLFWIGTKNGLFELKITAHTKIVYCKPIHAGPVNISCGILVNNSDYFVGTFNNGLFSAEIDNPTIEFRKVEKVPFVDILGLFYDENNGLCVNSSENITLLIPYFFKTLNLNEQNIVESVSLRPDGSLLVGSSNKAFVIENVDDQWQTTLLPFFDEQSLMSAFCENDRIWIGTLDGQILKFDLNQQRLSKIKDIQAGGYISHIFQDKAGNTWAAGNSAHGLIRISKNDKTRFYYEKGLASAKVLLESDSFGLYAGGGDADSYLFHYDHSLDTFYDISVPLNFETRENFRVEDLVFDHGENLLLATSDGLLKYHLSPNIRKEDRLERIDLKKVPIDEPAKALAISEEGEIWVSTTSGLLKYRDHSSLLFDKSSGLPSNNLTYRGLLFDENDNLWVATAKGLAFYQQTTANRRMTPTPIFPSIKVNGIKELAETVEQREFPHNSVFEIEFRSLSFPTDKVKYQNRILGKDTTWSSPKMNSPLFLSSLAPGKYTFQLRAQQQGGFLWSNPNSFHFTIVRPWYKKWWAPILFVVAVLPFLYALLRLYSWNLVKKTEKLESIIEERTKEINRQKNEIIEQKNKIIEQNEKVRRLTEKQFQAQIEFKNKELTTHTLNQIQKNEALKELRVKIIEAIRQTKRKTESKVELRNFLSLIDYSFRKDEEWDKFKLYFEDVHVGFFENLVSAHPNFTPHDLRHCALIKLNLTILETATILGISPKSVKTHRFRLRKKMGLPSQASLIDYIMQL